MIRYIMKRLFMLIPVIAVVMILSFLITHIMPGDPVRMMMGDFATEKQVSAMKHHLGYDKPFFTQFGEWLLRILRGDLGESLFLHEKVSTAIFSRLEPTFMLALVGESIGLLIGIPLGVIAAVKHRSWMDQSAIGISLAGVSIPSFWLSIMLIFVFSVKLHWFPVQGYVPIEDSGVGVLKYLILPGLTLGFMQGGIIARMTRSAMLDVLRQDYIRTAMAKGVAENFVVIRHALKNAMIPVITVIGFSMAVLLGGTWIVETVFNIPGTGSLAVNAIMKRDYPVIQGSMIFTALVYVIINIVVDVSYAFLNPKIKYK